jgi:tetratricopeptide (TPR) repeat protein
MGSRTQRVLAQPKLPWIPLNEAFEDGEPNLFSLLRWNFRLVETLHGREDELNKILKWARTPSKMPQARLVSGQGGFGKTRLVATAVDTLRIEGWSAGFLDYASDLEATNVGSKGLFLAVDYPEEQPDRTAALLRKLSQLTTAPYRIRVVFLSRRTFAEWEPQAAMLQGQFGRQELAALAPLSLPQCMSLAEEALSNLAKHMNVTAPDVRAVKNWFARSPENRIPLYATAATIHAAVAPQEAFGIRGPQLLKQLALRERERVRKTSEAIGLSSEGLERLLALGVLADGLSDQTISELITRGICEQRKNSDIISSLAKSPWWKEGRLMRLEPDLLAAAFVDQVLFGTDFPHGRSELPDWLFIALREKTKTLAGRLLRLLYDLDAIADQQKGSHQLETCLVQMISKEPRRANTFASVAFSSVSFWVANFAATISSELVDSTDDLELKANFLYATALHLSVLDRHEDSLKFAQRAVDLYRRIAADTPSRVSRQLLQSLHILVAGLAQTERFDEALAPAEEAVALFRKLSQTSPEFLSDLAGSLTNIAGIFANLDRDEEALVAAREAVDIQRELARGDPREYSHLAGFLSNLSGRLSRLGRDQEAFEASREAVDLVRGIAAESPEVFTSDLALHLHNLADSLIKMGRFEEAVSTAKEAIAIRRRLARAKQEVFLPSLGESLLVLSFALLRSGEGEEAIASAEEGASIFRILGTSYPSIFVRQRVRSLRYWRDACSLAGQMKKALAAEEELASVVEALQFRDD